MNQVKPLTRHEVPNTLLVDLDSHKLMRRGGDNHPSLFVAITCPKCHERRMVSVRSIRYRLAHEKYSGFCKKHHNRKHAMRNGGQMVSNGYRWTHIDLIDKQTKAVLDKYGFKFGGKNRKRYFQEHRLVAYKVFGEAVFEKGIVVRHLDGNGLNNSPKNLALGTTQDNVNDHVALRREVAFWRTACVALLQLTNKGEAN